MVLCYMYNMPIEYLSLILWWSSLLLLLIDYDYDPDVWILLCCSQLTLALTFECLWRDVMDNFLLLSIFYWVVSKKDMIFTYNSFHFWFRLVIYFLLLTKQIIFSNILYFSVKGFSGLNVKIVWSGVNCQLVRFFHQNGRVLIIHGIQKGTRVIHSLVNISFLLQNRLVGRKYKKWK
jgi:hypothetical protein